MVLSIGRNPDWPGLNLQRSWRTREPLPQRA